MIQAFFLNVLTQGLLPDGYCPLEMKALTKFSNSFMAMTISCLLANMRKCSKFVCLPWQFLKLPWQFLNCPTSSAAAIFLYKKYWNLYISTIKRPVFRMNEPKRRAISWKPEKARCWPLSTFHHGRKCILNFSNPTLSRLNCHFRRLTCMQLAEPKMSVLPQQYRIRELSIHFLPWFKACQWPTKYYFSLINSFLFPRTIISILTYVHSSLSVKVSFAFSRPFFWDTSYT